MPPNAFLPTPGTLYRAKDTAEKTLWDLVNDSNGRSWELLDQFASFAHNELHYYRSG